MRRIGLQQVRWLSESVASLGSECNAISPGGGLLGDRKWDTHFQCPNSSWTLQIHPFQSTCTVLYFQSLLPSDISGILEDQVRPLSRSNKCPTLTWHIENECQFFRPPRDRKTDFSDSS
jgi:hypothetical protein